MARSKHDPSVKKENNILSTRKIRDMELFEVIEFVNAELARLNREFTHEQERRKLIKLAAVYAFVTPEGPGRCAIMKTKHSLSSMEFHHMDGDSKEDMISSLLLAKSFTSDMEDLETELSKCVVLSVEAHRDLHDEAFDEDVQVECYFDVGVFRSNMEFIKEKIALYPYTGKIALSNIRKLTTKELQAEYDSHGTIKKMADARGVKASSLRFLLSERGVKVQNTGSNNKDLVRRELSTLSSIDLKLLYAEQGVTAIAKSYNTSPSSVSAILSERKIFSVPKGKGKSMDREKRYRSVGLPFTH